MKTPYVENAESTETKQSSVAYIIYYNFLKKFPRVVDLASEFLFCCFANIDLGGAETRRNWVG
jgi:hypothetical protein